MHKSIPALAALAFLALPTSSFADGAQTPAAQPVSATPATAQPASDKQICKQMTHEGMLVKTNVCHTQAEWDQIRQTQQRDVSDFQNRNYQMSSGH
jgi:hypothetical protein